MYKSVPKNVFSTVQTMVLISIGDVFFFLSFQGPIVPCTHAILAKWIPPNERSRMGAFVYAGKFIY